MMRILRVLLFTCLLLLAVFSSSATAINYCPPVWTQYQLKAGTFCYRLFGIRKTWREAEATCRRFSICKGQETAHLVSIGSAEEEDFVSSYWKEMRGPFDGEDGVWLGYHQTSKPTGGTWVWLDKLRSSYKNWGSKDTRGLIAGNCSGQVATEYTWPRWQRLHCHTQQHFICKMHAM